MRVAEMAGEPDWIGLGRTIPEETFNGWLDHFEREPFGSDHLYSFLANAFYLIVKSLHAPDVADRLQKSDFKWWGDAERAEKRQLEEQQAAGMSDEEIMDWRRSWENLRAAGTV